MSLHRGDVALAWYPFASGAGGKLRPCIIVQNDLNNSRLANTIVVQITSNLRSVGQSTAHLIEVNTAEGKQSGLLHDSVVSCINVATIEWALIHKLIGSLDRASMARVDSCLRTALAL